MTEKITTVFVEPLLASPGLQMSLTIADGGVSGKVVKLARERSVISRATPFSFYRTLELFQLYSKMTINN